MLCDPPTIISILFCCQNKLLGCSNERTWRTRLHFWWEVKQYLANGHEHRKSWFMGSYYNNLSHHELESDLFFFFFWSAVAFIVASPSYSNSKPHTRGRKTHSSSPATCPDAPAALWVLKASPQSLELPRTEVLGQEAAWAGGACMHLP